MFPWNEGVDSFCGDKFLGCQRLVVNSFKPPSEVWVNVIIIY